NGPGEDPYIPNAFSGWRRSLSGWSVHKVARSIRSCLLDEVKCFVAAQEWEVLYDPEDMKRRLMMNELSDEDENQALRAGRTRVGQGCGWGQGQGQGQGQGSGECDSGGPGISVLGEQGGTADQESDEEDDFLPPAHVNKSGRAKAPPGCPEGQGKGKEKVRERGARAGCLAAGKTQKSKKAARDSVEGSGGGRGAGTEERSKGKDARDRRACGGQGRADRVAPRESECDQKEVSEGAASERIGGGAGRGEDLELPLQVGTHDGGGLG
ncbi:unnamed protein product, partial [Discosporangium mesarthrocarpum]